MPSQKSDFNIFEFNKKRFFDNSIKINKKIFDDLFLKIKENNKKLYDFYSATYREYILNNIKIEYIAFIRKMIDMDKEHNFSSSNKKMTCEIVANIIKPLYNLLGYKEYNTDLWILKIKR